MDAPDDALASLELALELAPTSPTIADDEPPALDVLFRASEAAFAGGQPSRAVRIAEAGIVEGHRKNCKIGRESPGVGAVRESTRIFHHLPPPIARFPAVRIGLASPND
jgi:hypothetical protein